MHLLEKLFTESIGLKKHHYDSFISIAQQRKLNKKNFFVKSGSVCSSTGFISSGIMRSFVQGNKEEHNTDFYFPNHFVSVYSSFLTRLPAEHSIQALTDVELYCISHTQLNDLVKEDAEWLRFGKYMAECFLIRKCTREISLLKLSATERMDEMLKAYPGIEQLISQYHIASYLGIKPESLSRLKLMLNTKAELQ